MTLCTFFINLNYTITKHFYRDKNAYVEKLTLTKE